MTAESEQAVHYSNMFTVDVAHTRSSIGRPFIWHAACLHTTCTVEHSEQAVCPPGLSKSVISPANFKGSAWFFWL